ncbi:hypothetical protein Tco_0348268 [Tanacetum coccineum]
MKEGSTLKDHLDALDSILMDLENVEVKIDDEDVALILLVSLPSSFENFVNSFVDGVDLEYTKAEEKVDTKIDRSQDLEGQILEILVVIAKRKAIGSSIVLNLRKKASPYLWERDTVYFRRAQKYKLEKDGKKYIVNKSNITKDDDLVKSFQARRMEIEKSSRIDDEVVQDQRQRDDNDLQDERQDQPKEEEVEPRRSKKARPINRLDLILFLLW